MARKKKNETETVETPTADAAPAAPPEETPPPEPRTAEQSKLALQRKVRMFYDLQRLRIQAAGRTLEQAPGIEIKLHPDDVTVLVGRAAELHRQEKAALRDVEDHLDALPAYRALFVDGDRTRWRGCGVTLAAVLFSAIDIHRAKTVSSVWKFSGLDALPATRCRLCSAVLAEKDVGETEVEIQYSHPKGKCKYAEQPVPEDDRFASGKKPHRTKGEKSPYNGWLRSKLIGVLGPCLLKCGSPYKKMYDDYKHRKESAGWGQSPGHRHNAAVRYMVKMFLADFWEAWRRHEGLEVRPRYQEEYLGHVHGGTGAAA